MSTHQASQVADSVKAASGMFNALFDDAGFGSPPSSSLERLRRDLERAVANVFDATGPSFRTRFGVSFDFRPASPQVFEFSAADRLSLASTLETEVGQVHELFLGPTSSVPRGLIAKLTSVLKEAELDVDSHLGFKRLSVDALV